MSLSNGLPNVLTFATSILLIHAAWLYFYLCGSIVYRLRPGANALEEASPATALLHVVVTTATGMAITGFATFAAGMFGLLYPATLGLWLIVLFAAFCGLGDAPYRPAFWTTRFAAIAPAVTLGSSIVYAAAIFLAVPALLPETAYDALFYHLVYALDWATAHRIYADQYLRFPYYANNWLLLDSWLYVFKLPGLVDFLTWLSEALALLGIYASVIAFAPSRLANSKRTVVVAICAAASFALCPIVLRWGDTGMIDVPIGMFFSLTIAAALMACKKRARAWIIHTILCAAFFIGMKISLIAFLPLFAIIVWIIARKSALTVRRAAFAVAILTILSSPWYAKNFIQDGDPIAPVLNLSLRGVDSKWSKADLDGALQDLSAGEGPRQFAELPVDAIIAPATAAFREYGTTLVFVFLLVPGAGLCFLLLDKRMTRDLGATIGTAALFFAIAYWVATSHLGRYALLYYPVLSAYAALLCLHLTQQFVRGGITAVAVMAVAALPAPVGLPFTESIWQLDIAGLDTTLSTNESYLALHMNTWPEEERVSAMLLKSAGPNPRVYLIDAQTLNFPFKEHGITAIGDWFGPERFSDFARAVDAGEGVAFLQRFSVSAIMFPPKPLAFSYAQVSKLEEQLIRAGYTKDSTMDQPLLLYYARGIAK